MKDDIYKPLPGQVVSPDSDTALCFKCNDMIVRRSWDSPWTHVQRKNDADHVPDRVGICGSISLPATVISAPDEIENRVWLNGLGGERKWIGGDL